jgi:hypothetical protein
MHRSHHMHNPAVYRDCWRKVPQVIRRDLVIEARMNGYITLDMRDDLRSALAGVPNVSLPNGHHIRASDAAADYLSNFLAIQNS